MSFISEMKFARLWAFIRHREIFTDPYRIQHPINR